MKSFLTIFILLFALQNSFGQSLQNSEVDGLKYFDENKRWYNEFTEHWFQFFDIPESEIRDSIAQFDKIGKDLRTPENAWEGTYGNGGDTHGSYIRWSEKNGFIWLIVNKCNGGPMQIIRGKVVVTSSLVRLIPEKIVKASFDHGSHNFSLNKPIDFVLVKWRGENYIVRPTDLRDFADYAAGLNPETSGLYDEGRYFIGLSQKTTGSANDLPIFPAGYETYVKKPLKMTIVSLSKNFRRSKPPVSEDSDDYEKETVKNYDDLVTQFKLDIGKTPNLAPDTFIRFVRENEDDYSMDGIRIVKVFDDYSIGEYVTSVPKKTCRKSGYGDCMAEERRPLKVGMKLSTTGEW